MTILPPVRKLAIVAKDPGLRIGDGGPMVFAQVDVPAEILAPGPPVAGETLDDPRYQARVVADRNFHSQPKCLGVQSSRRPRPSPTWSTPRTWAGASFSVKWS
ncbi:MAG TPA: hypothetical protein VK403_05365 [Allosphingosinicella sp.]|nr:hypothetical protein [Allosphingosinicella sp.]